MATIVHLQKTAAEYLGVTATALRKWEREPGFPDTSNGYNIDAIREWIQRRSKKGSEQSELSHSLSIALKGEKLKQARLDTKKKELELAARESQLIPRKAVELSFCAVISGLHDLCEQLPDIIAAQLPQKHKQHLAQLLKRELEDMRNRIASDLKSIPLKSDVDQYQSH